LIDMNKPLDTGRGPHREVLVVGSGVAGQANAAGDLCVRVYDPGTLTEPVTFVVSITHF
jgi:hypothetical protein